MCHPWKGTVVPFVPFKRHFKLEFGTESCPTYRIKCAKQISEKSKTKLTKSVGVGHGADLQDDPLVRNIVVKKIVP
ncbi:hypothetical protein Ciccas_014315, partial [Cichlidogyrus casuarinus]